MQIYALIQIIVELAHTFRAPKSLVLLNIVQKYICTLYIKTSSVAFLINGLIEHLLKRINARLADC